MNGERSLLSGQWRPNSDIVYTLCWQTAELGLFLQSETVTSISALLKEQFTQTQKFPHSPTVVSIPTDPTFGGFERRDYRPSKYVFHSGDGLKSSPLTEDGGSVPSE